MSDPVQAPGEQPTLPPTAAPPGPSAFATLGHPSDSRPDQPPQRFGDYELLEEIARGGMGVVYRARQVALDRVVALKMILAGRLASEGDVERFRREARTAAALQHPGIVAIHDVGEIDGQQFFSMDLVEGRALADLVKENPLPPAQAIRYVHLIAQAIQYAHERGVLHRDLKPSNVLIDRFDQPRVTDFGLAKQTGGDAGLTDTGAVLGTPSYMPPEQASGERGKVGPPSDVYSLGAILYELVTGRPPFRAATALDTILQVLSEEPAPPRLLNPALGRDLETVILKCLSKDPSKRYPTAKDLANDLQAVQEGRPIRARPPALSEKLLLWAKKQQQGVKVGAAVLLVSALLIGGALFLLDWREQSDRGRLLLLTEGPALSGELFADGSEQPVVPRFTIPLQQPLTLPAGDYRLVVAGPRRFSETCRVLVERGQHLSSRRQLFSRPLHPGVDAPATDARALPRPAARRGRARSAGSGPSAGTEAHSAGRHGRGLAPASAGGFFLRHRPGDESRGRRGGGPPAPAAAPAAISTVTASRTRSGRARPRAR